MAKKRTDGKAPDSPVNETARVFAGRVRAKREESGLSVYAMAKRTGAERRGV